jgi:anti-sigma-K factor RskA
LPGNEIVKIDATQNFANTLIYLHKNQKSKLNYLQLIELPELQKGQAYQLWALPPDGNPIPMEVFKSQNTFVKVGYQGEVNYAITIESEAGAKVPNLANLIGVFKIG